MATLRSGINARACPVLEPKIATDDAESDVEDDDVEDDYLVGGVCFRGPSSVRPLRPHCRPLLQPLRTSVSLLYV